MTPVRLVLTMAPLALVAIGCFGHDLFGDTDPITYPGVDPATPLPPMTPSENGSPAIRMWRTARDAGSDR